MRILLEKFAGEIPKLEGNLLPDSYAQVATNCNFEKSSLRAFPAPLRIEAISITTCKSVFKHTENTNEHWVVSATDRHYVKSPISGDTFERVYFTGATEPRFFANDNVSGGGFDESTDYYKLGIPAPTAGPAVGSSGGGAEYRGYVFSFVNSYGDEGPPSPIVSISDYSTGNITLASIPAAPTGRAINRIFVYRTNSGTSGTGEFQFALYARWFDAATGYAVGEFVIYSGAIYKCTTIHPAGAWNAGHFTAGDDVTNANLLSVYPKVNFDPPPDGLTGLVALANGSFAGFVGNSIYFSEPFYPHAWPTDYIIPLNIDIVGIAAYQDTVVAAGSGAPCVLYGSHPLTMARWYHTDILPLVSSRGIVSGNSGVFFVSTAGLIFSQGLTMVPVADQLMNVSDLEQYTPATLALYWFETRLFAFDSAGTQGFFIDFSPEQLEFVRLTPYAHAGVVDSDGFFYIVENDTEIVDENDPPAVMPLAVKKWAGSSDYLQYTWKSKEFIFDAPINMAAFLISLDQDFINEVQGLIDLSDLNAATFAAGLTGSLGVDGPLGGGHELGGDELLTLQSFGVSSNTLFKFYASGILRKSITASGATNRGRLPARYMAMRAYFELIGYAPVKRISIATSMDEL